jgi:hypothetical protein
VGGSSKSCIAWPTSVPQLVRSAITEFAIGAIGRLAGAMDIFASIRFPIDRRNASHCASHWPTSCAICCHPFEVPQWPRADYFINKAAWHPVTSLGLNLRSYAHYYNETWTHRIPEQGCATSASGPADRTHRILWAFRRATSPIRPNLDFRYTHPGTDDIYGPFKRPGKSTKRASCRSEDRQS